MQNIMELGMEKLLDLKAVISGVWDLKTSLGKLGSERRIKP